MELYQLRTFIVAAEEGQITKASRRLHLTQPAVSAQIKALEQEIGLPLFERTGCGIVATRAGEELLKDAYRVVGASKELVLHGRKLREQLCQELRLGTIMHPRFIELGPLVLRLLEIYPMLRIKLNHGLSERVIESMRSGELDAAFLLGGEREDDISYVDLARIEYCVVAPIAWAADIDSATLEELAKFPWLGAPPGSSQATLLARLFPDSGRQPVRIVEVDQETTMVCLVLEGVGLCLMRRELAEGFRRAEQVAIWPGAGPKATLSFIYETAREGDPAIAATIKVAGELWRGAHRTNAIDVLAIGAS